MITIHHDQRNDALIKRRGVCGSSTAPLVHGLGWREWGYRAWGWVLGMEYWVLGMDKPKKIKYLQFYKSAKVV